METANKKLDTKALRRYPRYGWKALIGVICIAEGVANQGDFYKIAPEGVAMARTGVDLGKDESVEEMSKIPDRAVKAANARILTWWRPDVILWLCSAGSFLKGVGGDAMIIKRIEESLQIPTTTSSTAMMDAFKALGLKKITLVTPYPADANKLEAEFIEGNGVKVPRYGGFEYNDLDDIISLHPYQIFDMVKKIDSPESDGVFISCSGLDVFDIIEPLEMQLRKPIVTTNQVSYWKAFKMAGVKEPIAGYGKLLREPR